MRKVGITDTARGLETTFDMIVRLSINCRFNDCTHINRKDSAVLEAVENGEINKASYENYLKTEREKAFLNPQLKRNEKKIKILERCLRTIKRTPIKKMHSIKK